MATAEVLFKIKTDVKDAIGNIGDLDKKAAALAKTMAGIGLVKVGTEVLSGLATKIYEVGSAAESSFALVETLMTGTAKENKKLKKDIKDLASTYGVSGKAAADAAYQALSAGVEQSKLASFMDKAFKTSIASGADMTTVVDAATTAINAYGLEGAAADKVFNTFVETQNAGKTTTQEFGSNLGKVAPLAATLGISIEQVAAATATMTAAGIGTAEAMTMQKALFNELSSAGSKVAKILKKKTGKSFDELMASGKDLSEVMKIIQKESDKQGVSMNNLFGSVEAANGALAIGGKNSQSFKDNLARLTDETHETDSAFETMSGTAEHSSNVIKEKFNAGLIDVYNTLMEKATPALNWLAENMDWITPIIISLTIAFGVFTIVLGIYAIATGIAALANWAFLAPVLLIVLAIFLLIGVVILLVYHWEELVKVTKIGIKNFVKNVKEAWDNLTSSLSAKWEAFKQMWKDLWNSMKNGFINAWNSMKNAFINAWNSMKNGISNALGSIKGGMGSALGWLISKIESFKNKLLSLRDTVVSAFQSIAGGIKQGIDDGIGAIINTIKSVFNGFTSNVNKAIGTINKIPGVKIPKIPKLAIGTNMVNKDGLTFLHKGEAVVPAANVEGGGFTPPRSWSNDQGGQAQNVTIEKVEVSGVDNVQTLVDKIMQEMASKLKGSPKFRRA